MSSLKPLVLLIPCEAKDVSPATEEVMENNNQTQNGEDPIQYASLESDGVKADRTPIVLEVVKKLISSRDVLLKQYGISLKVCTGESIISQSSMQDDIEGLQIESSLTSIVNIFSKERIKPHETVSSLDANNKIIIVYDMNLTKLQFNGLVETDEKNPLLDGILELSKSQNMKEVNTFTTKNDSQYVTQFNAYDYVNSQMKEKEGHWYDVTTSTINVAELVQHVIKITESREAISKAKCNLDKLKNVAAVAPSVPVLGKKGVSSAALNTEIQGNEDETKVSEEVMALEDKLSAQEEEYNRAFDTFIPSIGSLLQSLLLAKNSFHGWAGDDKTIVDLDPLARFESHAACYEASRGYMKGIWQSKPLYAKYQNEINQFPRSLNTVGACLYSIVRSVVGDLPADKWAPSPLNHALVSEGVVKVILDSKETGKQATLTSFHKEAQLPVVQNADVIVCEEGDLFALEAARSFKYYDKTYPSTVVGKGESLDAYDGVSMTEKSNRKVQNDVGHPTVEGLVEFLKHARFRSHLPRFLGERRFPRYSKLPPLERNIQETELLSFTALSAVDFHRGNQLVEFHRMLSESAAHIDDFTGSLKKIAGIDNDTALQRKYFRNISAFSFQQILAAQLLKEPDIVRQYYPMTDELLMVLHWIPPEKRMAKRSWDASMSVRTRSSFKEYEKLKIMNNGKPVDKPAPCIMISKSELEAYRRDTVFLTPAGKSMAFIHKIPSTGDVWITVSVDDSIIGLRKYASIIKPDAADITKIARTGSSRRSKSRGPSGSGKKTAGGINASESMDSVMATSKVHDEIEGNGTSACKSACFFCEINDTRFLVTSSNPSDISSYKPDGKGTVCISAMFDAGLSIAVASDNTIRITEPALRDGPSKASDPLGEEEYRLIAVGGVITRHLKNSPFRTDTFHPNGTRTLTRSSGYHSKGHHSFRGFYGKLLAEAPSNWQYVRLETNGKILYFSCPPGTTPEKHGTTPSNMKQIMKSCIDAETHAEVCTFRDGRVIVRYTDNLREIHYPEGTRVVIHAKNTHMYITKAGLPTIELNVANDRCCYGHANGMQVPLSKGGDCLRSLISCPDGTSIFVKYDITVTTKVNGSLKLVCRDRTVIKAFDGGDVVYLPRTSWDEKAASEFEKDCADTSAPIEAEGTAIADGDNSTTLRGGFEANEGLETMPTFSTVTGASASTKHKTNRRRSTKAKAVTISENGSHTTVPAASTLIVKTNTKETFYNFNVDKLTCHIQDYEYNHFYLNLSDTIEKEVAPAPPLGKAKTGKSTRSLKASTGGLKREASVKLSKEETNTTASNAPSSNTPTSNTVTVANNPLCPVLNLAGEVEGMKPTAVTDSPIEPRLYVLNRNGNVVEVLCNQDITEKENLIKMCPDAFCVKSDIIAPPCNLGGGKQTTYFLRRRLGTADDGFSFEEVFGCSRKWENRKLPAAASLAITGAKADPGSHGPHRHGHHGHHHHHHGHGHHGHGHHGHHGHDDALSQENSVDGDHDHHQHGGSGSSVVSSEGNNHAFAEPKSAAGPAASYMTPRIYIAVNIEEHVPLSADGYEHMKQSIRSWSNFRHRRMETINRFAVEDNRSAEELDLEEKNRVRLKLAYKKAKEIRRKNKEIKKEEIKKAAAEAAGVAPPAPGTPGSIAPPQHGQTASKLGLQTNKIQALDAIGEEEEEEADFSDEEEDEEFVDPVAEEITAAFETFATSGPDFVERIAMCDVRAALIQLFNSRITQEFVEKIYELEGISKGAIGLNVDEFDMIYYRAVSLKEEEEGGANGEGAEEEKEEDSKVDEAEELLSKGSMKLNLNFGGPTNVTLPAGGFGDASAAAVSPMDSMESKSFIGGAKTLPVGSGLKAVRKGLK